MRFCKKMVFLFVVFAIAFMSFALNVSAIDPITGFAYNMTTQFGEDASTEANINFLSNSDKAYVEYTLATDTTFANAIKVEGDKRQLGDDFAEHVNDDVVQDTRYYTTTDYNYEVYLKDLTPGTKYIYRVTDGSQKSNVFSFKTATGDSSSFTFAYINDPQIYTQGRADSYYECLDLAEAKALANGTPLNFVLGGGDMVESGGDAWYWNLLLSAKQYQNIQYMATSGNHEFTGLQSYLGLDGRFYALSVNNPKNGCESYGDNKEVSCYFKYNDTLFILLSSSGAQRKDQVEWVDKVLAENPAQFVIVNIHYPVNSTATDNVREFGPVFDKYGVDLVLFGHSHVFEINNQYYNYKATNENGKGTTYMSMASSEKSGSNEAIYSIITVNKDSIQAKNYNRKGAQLESFVLKNKRTSSFELPEFDKENFKKSITITPDFEDSTKAKLSWDASGYTNVKYINLYNEEGTQVCSNFIYGDVITYADFGGLEANKEYSFDVELVYNDGSTEKVKYNMNTNVVYGELQNLEISTTSTRFRLMYTPKFKSDVKSLKVYVNGESVLTGKVSDTRLLIPLDVMVEGQANTVEVKGVLADGSEVAIYSTTYGEDASALDNAKEEAVKAVEGEFAKLKEADFSSENWASIVGEKATSLETINAATDEATIDLAVEAFKLIVKQTVENEAEEKAEKLAKAKETAKQAVNAYYSGLKESDYTAENWAAIQTKKAEALEKIEAALTEKEAEDLAKAFEEEVSKIEKVEAPGGDVPGDEPGKDDKDDKDDSKKGGCKGGAILVEFTFILSLFGCVSFFWKKK